MARKHAKFHSLSDNCFYKLPSPKKLSELLWTSEEGLNHYAKNENMYLCWEQAKKNGGTRTIEAPNEGLKRVQKRIADLLYGIRTPAFVMAPAKNRSYVQNAAYHLGAAQFNLLDVEDFFPSCKFNKVYWFFFRVMKCPADVATILAKIVTYKGHLPQGSPCSPILAFYSYFDMWNEINEIAEAKGCKFSLYADDITVSGSVVPKEVIYNIKRALNKHGHRSKAEKERSVINRAADITGVIVSNDKLLLPNRQHKKLSEVRKLILKASSEEEKASLALKIRGRVAQKSQIECHLSKLTP